MELSIAKRVRTAWKRATPLITIRTPDPAVTMREIGAILRDNGKTPPILRWDIVTGLTAANEPGQGAIDALRSLVDRDGPPFEQVTVNPVQAMEMLPKGPDFMVVFMLNSHLFLNPDNPAVLQAVWNLRDPFKSKGCCWIGLTPPAAPPLPAELVQDIVLFDEPLPDDTQLGAVVTDVFKSAGLATPDDATRRRATESLSGLSSFLAEQVTAISLSESGLDFDALREAHRKTIEQTPGLSVWRGGETFDDIGGCENIKDFMRRVLSGKRPPRAIVYLDEIEKSMSGASGDTSGVSQEMLGTLLSYMQDNSVTGSILIGPPGAAKSAIAKATGNEGGIPTIAFDLTAMKGSLVGQSGANLRGALKVVSAVAQQNALFLATCNKISILPPELRRRFTFGTFFFDLPDKAERARIWDIYRKVYSIASDAPLPADDEGWTGAEIKQCADLSFRLNCSPREAAAYVVPVAKSDPEGIERLRQMANGKFISAAYPGVYQYRQNAPAVVQPIGRRMSLRDEGVN